jgi:hypothetical protein
LVKKFKKPVGTALGLSVSDNINQMITLTNGLFLVRPQLLSVLENFLHFQNKMQFLRK